MSDDTIDLCERCGEPTPPGEPICPHCEDLAGAGLLMGTIDREMPPEPARYPPHGGTTR